MKTKQNCLNEINKMKYTYISARNTQSLTTVKQKMGNK